MVHVVEDDDSVRTAVVRLLRAAGFQAQPYASPAEFLLVAGENAGGCMVLDVGLPGMSGIELHARWRSGATARSSSSPVGATCRWAFAR